MRWHVASEGLRPLGKYLRHLSLAALLVEKVRLRAKPDSVRERAGSTAKDEPPERKQASELDRLLWAGFATDAVEELKALKSSDADPEERAAAAWALARWYASVGDCAPALNELNQAKGLIAEQDWGRDHRLLEMSILVDLGRAREAEEALQAALSSLGELPEFCLFAARVIGAGVGSDNDRLEIDGRRLAWINKPFITAGFAPLELADPQRPLTFANFSTGPVAKHPKAAAAKLSVIMPAYNAAETLPVALRSVLAQSWDNLEVLVVDDASIDDTWSLIQSFAQADRRVKPLRHDENRGAYGARNTGLRHASGDLVTVHDSDDWSHPEKFAVQATGLLDTGRPLNTTMSARIFPDLAVRLKLTNMAVLYDNIGSLMVRRADLVAIGGWDEPRMAADEELYYRLRTLHRIEPNIICPGVPLTLYLVRGDSLTASSATGIATIKYGARRQYKEAYRYWHGVEIAKAEPDLVMSQRTRPFPIPAICKTQRADQLRYDVLYVSDFSQPGGNAVFNAYMMEAGHRLGLKQAWFQWPSVDALSRTVDAQVRKRVHADMADCIVAGENVDSNVLVLYHPAILNHVPDPLPQVRARTCILVADQAPYSDKQRNAYDFDQAIRAAHRTFGVEPIVAPVLPSIRRNIRAGAKRAQLTKRNWLPPLDAKAWQRDVSPWDGTRSPVIGGYTLHYLEGALLRRQALRDAYCADRACEVRIVERAKKQTADLDALPLNWRLIPLGEIEIRDFLATLDFCICYPHKEAAGILDPAPIEAMAVGVPVILPPRFREVYGDAAAYAEPEDVFDAINELWCSKAKYEKQVGRGRRFVEDNCSYEDFGERLRPYLEGPRVSGGAWSKFLSRLRLPLR
jgi:tetratricopeptide (TPR) repeat protein